MAQKAGEVKRSSSTEIENPGYSASSTTINTIEDSPATVKKESTTSTVEDRPVSVKQESTCTEISPGRASEMKTTKKYTVSATKNRYKTR